jgi:hypothetical protein
MAAQVQRPFEQRWQLTDGSADSDVCRSAIAVDSRDVSPR